MGLSQKVQIVNEGPTAAAAAYYQPGSLEGEKLALGFA